MPYKDPAEARRVKRESMRRWRANNKADNALRVREQNRKHPEKAAARWLLTYAVQTGRVIREPCRDCGDPNSHAHHYRGYAREHALDVRWLCPLHHAAAHRQLAEVSGEPSWP